MGLSYFIFKTRLLNETKYLGKMVLKGSFDQERLVNRMLEMGTGLSKEGINGVLSLFKTAVERICSDGFKVNLDGFVQFTPSMGGTFEGVMDGFEPARNVVYLTSQVSKALNQRFTNGVAVEKISNKESKPALYEVEDMSDYSINERVTVGDIVSIYGEFLKFDLANPLEYLRFVNADQPTEFVNLTRFKKLVKLEVVFIMPAVNYSHGYFEMANSLGTKTLRLGRSETVAVHPAVVTP